MSYRGPNAKRILNQTSAVTRYAGHTATWVQWVSASAGIAAAGIGDTNYYRRQLITAHFAVGSRIAPGIMQRQQAAGMLFDGKVFTVTREKLGPLDTVEWNGESFRIESEPVKSQLNNLWVSQLKRGQ